MHNFIIQLSCACFSDRYGENVLIIHVRLHTHTRNLTSMNEFPWLAAASNAKLTHQQCPSWVVELSLGRVMAIVATTVCLAALSCMPIMLTLFTKHSDSREILASWRNKKDLLYFLRQCQIYRHLQFWVCTVKTAPLREVHSFDTKLFSLPHQPQFHLLLSPRYSSVWCGLTNLPIQNAQRGCLHTVLFDRRK